jgi:transcriptional regulator with XRE-family HTH domain
LEVVAGKAQTVGEDLAFGALLRRFRLSASLSQAVLAERAHVSTNAIAALERGRRGVPRPATVLLLADALRLGPADRAALIDAAGRQRAGVAPPGTSGLPPIPTSLTSFVGRDQELAAVQQLLAGTRVLTLSGVGGMGKTRLALKAARHVAGEVAFVELSAVTTESALPHAVASVLACVSNRGSRSPIRLARLSGRDVCFWSWTTVNTSSQAARNSARH